MFDKKKFSYILQKITDTYTSISDFSEKSEVNRTYLSKYINMKLDNPPTPKILMKIAINSNDVVSYDNLMNICGYITNGDNLENTKNAEKTLSYDSLVKNISLNNNEKIFLNNIYAEYLELRKKGNSINDIEKNILKKIQSLPSEQYNIQNMKQAFKLYILSDVSKRIINRTYNTKAEIDSRINYFNYIKQLEILESDFPETKQKDTVSDNINNNYLFNIPVLGKIAAGQPLLAEEYLEGYLPVDPNIYGMTTPDDYFYLKVSGESMNLKIHNGDYALIHKQDYADDGDIIVAIVNEDDEATLKRYKHINESTIALEPMSTFPMETIYIDLKDTNFKIIGKAIGKFGKF